jgi:adenylate cyclase class 2
MLEREVKLSFDSPEQARAAVTAARATLVRPRRLQHDVLFDTADQQLRQRGCALRIRFENGAGVLTFKGPVMPGAMKLREEHESKVEDSAAVRRVLEGLGYRAWFTYEKFREEYELPEVIAAIDETPVGTFVELEGSEPAILAAAESMGRTPDAFVLASYRTLFLQRRPASSSAVDDMVFPAR